MATYSNVGIIAKGKEGGLYIKVDKDLDIQINGKSVAGMYININKPTEKFDRMLAAGKITEEEYDEKTARFGAEGDLSWIRQELTIKQD